MWAATVLLGAALSGAGAPAVQFADSHPAMGTDFSIRICARDANAAALLHEAAFREIDRIDDLLSNYLPTSELSRINQRAGAGWVRTTPEMLGLLERAEDFSRRSDGAFDITVGPLMRAWGFYRGTGRLPTEAQIDAARARVGWSRVRVDRARGVRFSRPGVELDPGAWGKGYALDRAAAVLRRLGVEAALLDAGGSSIVALGAPPGARGWTVRVPDPEARSRTLSVVQLCDASLSTSGERERSFRAGERTFSHIMDPRTGRPVQGMLQTTVIAPEAAVSDVLSTAVFVLGVRDGRRLLASVEQASGLLVTDGRASARVVSWRWPGNEERTP